AAHGSSLSSSRTSTARRRWSAGLKNHLARKAPKRVLSTSASSRSSRRLAGGFSSARGGEIGSWPPPVPLSSQTPGPLFLQRGCTEKARKHTPPPPRVLRHLLASGSLATRS